MARFINAFLIIFIAGVTVAQDDCGTAIDLNNDLGPFGFCQTYNGGYTTSGLSPEPDLAAMGCDFENNPTIWFVIDPPPGATNMNVSITGSSLPNATMGLFIENGCNPPYNQAGPFSGCITSPAEYDLLVNDAFSYYIVVSSQSGSGFFNIHINFDNGASFPANDLCANAIELYDEIPLLDQNNFCSSYDNSPICDNESTVWYFVEIPDDNYSILILLLQGSIGFASVSLFDECGGDQIVNPLGCIPALNTGCLPAGNYYIEVATTIWHEGTFDIEVNIAQCAIPCEITEPNIEDIMCNDNGTPSDPSDDYITFTLDPQGTGLSTGYDVFVSSPGGVSPINGLYGGPTLFSLGAGSANSTGDFTITIVDQGDANCTFVFDAMNPNSCSPECEIIDIGLSNIECNDNGTPYNPEDDYIQFEIFPTGNNIAADYSISVFGGGVITPTSGFYGIGVMYSLYPGSAGGGDLLITITDNDDPNCTFDFEIEDPETCSDECQITGVVFSDIICNNNDTPSDPNDDYITYVVTVEGYNVALEYFMEANSTTTIITSGFFGIPSPGSLDLGSANIGDIEITFIDINNPDCLFVATLPNPGPCSDSCNLLEANLENFQCDSNGTENDASDDFYVFTLNPTGTNLGASYSVSANGIVITPASANYGIQSGFSTETGSAGVGDFIITIEDDDSLCEIEVSLEDLGSCSSNCLIDSVQLLSVLCNDNLTPTDSTDDFIIIEFLNYGSNTSDSVSVEIIDGILIDTFAIVDTNRIEISTGSLANDSISLIVSDLEQSFCRDTIVFLNPGPCSDECIIDSIQIISILCSDNETNTPDDDIVEISFFVQGTNVGMNYMYSIMGFENGNALYGDTVTLTSTTSITGINQFVLMVMDENNSLCVLDLEIENPGPCSTDCTIISADILNIECNDSGTITDDADDFITFDLQVDGNNNGNTFTISINGGLYTFPNLIYGIINMIQLPSGSALEGDFSIVILDDDILECSASYMIANPGSCSTTCSLSSPTISNVLCNDNGTPSDLSDDFITFTMDVIGINAGSGFQLASDTGVITPNTSNYNSPTNYSLEIGSAGQGNYMLTITDNEDLTCSTFTTLIDPGTCSDECIIDNIVPSNIICNDALTPSDPSDDFITFTLEVTGINTGTGFQLTSDMGVITPNTGNYSSSENYSLEIGSAGQGNITITITDIEDPTCSAFTTLIDPGTCSDECQIESVISSNAICNDSGTPSDPTDDFITFDLIVSGINVGSTFTITNSGFVITPSGGNYDVINSYSLPIGSAGNGNIIIEIEDDSNPVCTYTTMIIDPGDCSSSCDFAIDAGEDIELNCYSPMITHSSQFENSPNIQWTNEEGDVISNLPEIQINDSGLYFVTFDYGNGCVLIDSLNVTTDFATPIFELGNDTLLNCFVDNVDFIAPLEGNYNYTWFLDELVVSEQLAYQCEESGQLILEIQDLNNGCIYKDSLHVMIDTLIPNAVIYVDPLSPIDCIIQSVVLTTENEENVKYQWAFGDEIIDANQITISESIEVNLLAIDTLNGCSDSDNIIIEDNEEYPYIELFAEDVYCSEDDIIISADASQSGPTISSIWTDANGAVLDVNNYNLATTSSGLYIFTLTDNANGCVNSDSILIDYNPIEFPEYSIYQSEESDGSVSVEIISDNMLIGDWIVNGVMICSACTDINLNTEETLVIEILLTDGLGCVQSEQLVIQLDQDEGIYFPNIFSPNGDGINDSFGAHGPSDIEVISFTIYDRWGNLMHSAQNKRIGDSEISWDGIFNGKTVQSGVYVYCFTTLNDTVCGTITLVR